jgi:hypothetical protein
MSHHKRLLLTTDHLLTEYVNLAIVIWIVSYSLTDLETCIPKVLHGFTWSLQKNGQILHEIIAVKLNSSYDFQSVPINPPIR